MVSNQSLKNFLERLEKSENLAESKGSALSKRGLGGVGGCLWDSFSRFCGHTKPRGCSQGLETEEPCCQLQPGPSSIRFGTSTINAKSTFLKALKNFFCLWLLVFPGCWLLQKPVWGIWGRKKTQGTHYHVIPQVLRSLGNLPLLSTESSCICFIHNI